MTRTGFVFANLFRKKTRTVLTMLSVVTAFLLFGLLQAVNVLFSAGADFVGATRLVTQARVSFTSSLPMRLLPEIESIPGVEAGMWQQWFGAVWQENTQLIFFAADPARLHAVYPEWVMPPQQWKAFEETRTGMIVGRALADQYGWKIGDKLPIASNIFPGPSSKVSFRCLPSAPTARNDLILTPRETNTASGFPYPVGSRWARSLFGRNSIAEMGDEAAPPIDYARLAWMAGDIDTYYYQCYIATRELLHQFVKQNGAQYFRRLQPYHQYFSDAGSKHSIEAMPAQVFISNLFGGLHVWQVDGPAYPRQHGERQYQNRWVRFSSPSVGRFYRDHIRAEALREEFDDWKARFDGKPEPGVGSQWLRDDPHIMPSLVRLLSLTLDAPLAEIEALAGREGERMPYELDGCAQSRSHDQECAFNKATSMITRSCAWTRCP